MTEQIGVISRQEPSWSADPPERVNRFAVPDPISRELARFLEQQIIYGELRPGERLIEADIVSRHRVGRSPVREAFRVLEIEGLAIRSLRRGTRVSELSVEDMNDLTDARVMLEGQAASNAARYRSAAQLVALQEACADIRAAQGTAIARQFFAATLRFSGAIYAASASPTLRRLLDNVGKQGLRYRFHALLHAPELMPVTADTAAAMCEAFARRDGAAARQLTEGVLEYARGLLTALMK